MNEQIKLKSCPSGQAGIDVFTRKDHRDVVIESLKYCQENKGLIIYGWCIMSNHLHLILFAQNNVSDILGDFKKFTSKQLMKSIDEPALPRIDKRRSGRHESKAGKCRNVAAFLVAKNKEYGGRNLAAKPLSYCHSIEIKNCPVFLLINWT